MNANRSDRTSRFCLLLSAFACVALIFAAPSQAQVGGGGMGRKKPSDRPDRPTPQQPPKVDRETPGNVEGRILKFQPAKEGSDDEDLLGYLSVKPFGKNEKSLKLKVNRSDDLRISVAAHEFELDEIAEVCVKGLSCSAGWGFEDPDAKRKVKELHSLSFATLEVEGKIAKIEDGMVHIKAKPKNGQDWPGADSSAAGAAGRGGGDSNKPKKIRTRTLKLRIMEDLSKITDEDAIESDLNEFAVDDEVDATVVVGTKESMMVAMRPLGAKDSAEESGRAGRPGGPREPQPGGRGPTVGG